jgi:hypothetical protein
MRVLSRGLLAMLLLATHAAPARAEGNPGASDSHDHYELSARSDTYAQLFRRALLPGSNGSLVSTDTAAPLYEYASLRAADLDTPWRKDSLDLELATWGRVWLDARNAERLFDGDVQVANARYHQGPFSLRLGRQQVAGGAARFSRFDGLELTGALGSGIEASAYGGWTVLPRWNEQLRYQHLGAAPDSLRHEWAALQPGQRSESWLAGGRFGWGAAEQRLGVSFHEQHERGGLGRRSLGLDARTPLASFATLGTNTVLDVDRARFADARLWLDTSPAKAVDWSFEYLHTEPALFLSNQSVLSVFGGAGYDEAGSYAPYRQSDALSFDGSGFIEVYQGERPGARAELTSRWFADAARRTLVRLAYARLLAPENGYHSLRTSLAQRFNAHFRGTVEAYAYLYDRAIRNYRASTVYAGTLSFEPTPALSLLWGVSLAHSPYANLDAQTELRLSCVFERSPPRRYP